MSREDHYGVQLPLTEADNRLFYSQFPQLIFFHSVQTRERIPMGKWRQRISFIALINEIVL